MKYPLSIIFLLCVQEVSTLFFSNLLYKVGQDFINIQYAYKKWTKYNWHAVMILSPNMKKELAKRIENLKLDSM